jgi:protein gp37
MVEKRLAVTGWPTWPQHAGLMITVVNQAEADRDIPRLLALKAKLGIPWVGLSMEPLLGPVDLTHITRQMPGGVHEFSALECDVDPVDCEWGGACLDWVITGGESGPGARPMHPAWARSLRDQCQSAGVPFFFKQWGEWGPDTGPLLGRDPIFEGKGPAAFFRDGTWNQSPNGFTVDLEASQGCGECVYRLGKKINGRLLDGREWNEMPGALTNG